jgi:hypothetical protein
MDTIEGGVPPAAAAKSSYRAAVVLHPALDAGEGSNVTGILVGGLRCDAFTEAIVDLNGTRHAAISCNLVVLRAKTEGQLHTCAAAAQLPPLKSVVFTRCGQRLSNSFDTYREQVVQGTLRELGIVGVALFGPDEDIRRLTRQFSVFR